MPWWELHNKMMRIGLHGMCGYIKLERGRIGGTGELPSKRPPLAGNLHNASAPEDGSDAAAASSWPWTGRQDYEAGHPSRRRGGETTGDRLV